MASSTNLIECKHCHKEVAKSVKTCPQCGGKLKMGFFAKMFIGFAALIAIVGISSAMKPKFDMAGATASSLQPNGDLASTFNLMSSATDLQRDNREREITGSIVDWTLPVHEVSGSGNHYRIQTSSGSGFVGTFIGVDTRDATEVQRVTALRTGDMVHVKGRISGVSLRSIRIEDAILMQ